MLIVLHTDNLNMRWGKVVLGQDLGGQSSSIGHGKFEMSLGHLNRNTD